MSKEKIVNFFKLTGKKIGNFFKVHKTRILKILKISGNVLFYAFILIVLLFSIANIRKDNANKDDFPNLFGTGFLVVDSYSMEGNNDDGQIGLNYHDLIFVKKVTDRNRIKIISNLQKGDIITFFDTSLQEQDARNELSNYLNTHRIVNKFTLDNGDIVFHVQGDKAHDYVTPYNDSSNDFAESIANNEGVDYQVVYSTYVMGIYESKMAGAGSFVASLTEPYSVPFMLIIVLPILAFFIFEVIMVVKNIFAIRSEKNIGKLKADKEQMLAELDAQKEAMRKEILEQIKKEQEEKMLKKDDNEDLNNKDE